MKIYCICLPDRFAHCLAFFDSLHLRASFTTIVLKSDIENNRQTLVSNGLLCDKESLELKCGEVACALSHRNAWLAFLASTDDKCVIFEDDNAIPRNPKVTRLLLDKLFKLDTYDLLNLSPCWNKSR